MKGKKRNIFTILSMVVLIVIIMINRLYNKSISVDYYAVKNISDVTQINLIDKKDSIFIEKKNNKWLINGQWDVKRKSIDSFLEIIERIEIKSIFSDETAKKYIPEIKAHGVYVKIFKSNKIIQSYIFYENYNHDINSFLLDTSNDKLYLIKITGYSGKLENYYNSKLWNWKDNILIHIQPFEIKSIRVNYLNKIEESYNVKIDSLSRYSLYNYKNQEIYSIPKNIERYFTYFQNITYEKEILKNELTKTDTIYQFASLTVTHEDGKSTSYKFYKTPVNKNKNTEDFDLNYTLVKDDKYNLFFKVKYVDIDLLLKDIQYFK